MRLRRLAADLEILAAAEATWLRLDAVPGDLADIAHATVELLSPLAEERSITIHIDDYSAPTNGDPDRLQQVVINLVTNSLKFTPPGGTRIGSGVTGVSRQCRTRRGVEVAARRDPVDASLRRVPRLLTVETDD